MAAAIDGHTRLVAWLKIVLPLLALGLLSTIFLVARQIDPAQSIPYSDVDVAELAREQRIGAPSYSGVTSGGAAVSFEAESARPEQSGDLVMAFAPRTRIDLPGGRVVTITSARAEFDRRKAQARMQGDLVVASSDGYRMQTEGLDADLTLGEVVSGGPVSGVAPFGALNAGNMRLTRLEDGTHVLSFEQGVKLLYRPGE